MHLQRFLAKGLQFSILKGFLKGPARNTARVQTFDFDRIFSVLGAPGPPKIIPKSTQNGVKILSERVSENCSSEFADFAIFSLISENADMPHVL